MLEVAAKTWTPERVRKAIADAFRVLHAVEGKVGHKRLKAAWPEYRLDQIDIAEQRLAGNIHHGRLKSVVKPNSVEIWRMETVLIGSGTMLGWLNGQVRAYPEHRRVLIIAAQAQARRYSGREAARWLGMPEATFRHQRDFAAGIIAKQLNAAGVKVWV